MPRNCLCLPTPSFPRGPTFYHAAFLQLSGRRMKKHSCSSSAEPKRLGICFPARVPTQAPPSGQPRLWLFLGTLNRLLCATRNPQSQGLCAPQLHLSMPLLPFLSRAESLSHLTRIQSVQMSCLLQTCSKINPRKLPDVLFVLWCFSVLVSRD